jgi:hypothetical protein
VDPLGAEQHGTNRRSGGDFEPLRAKVDVVLAEDARIRRVAAGGRD